MAKRITKHTQEESMEQLSTTEVSPVVARIMSWTFMVLICAVPAFQIAVEVSRGQRPQVLSLVKPLQTGQLRTLLTRQFTHGFEEDLERVSVAKAFVQPRVQTLLTGAGGFGNDRGVVGRDGWLFYQPGIDYVSGPNFIEKTHLAALARKMADKQREPDPHPDPRPAIRKFSEDLKKQGIWLIVLPAPDKASMQPGELTGRVNLQQGEATPNNSGYAEFVREMRAAGVDVFNATPDVVNPREIRFLRQDTHWTPEFMDEIAAQLAAHISRVVPLKPRPPTYELREQSVSRVGDIVDMLSLTKDQRLYEPQTIRVQQVVDRQAGKPVEADPTAAVLVLGDSYTNIYSQPEMGWGASAGFAEHLAYHLQRPVDVIAFNGGGAARTRGELARPENAERLGYKKVVVLEFAIRDLLGENWKPLPVVKVRAPPLPQAIPERMPLPATPVGSSGEGHAAPTAPAETPAVKGPVTKNAAPPQPALAADAPLIVVGQIVKASAVPQPGSVPYKDCLSFAKIRVEKIESGSYDEQELIAAFQVMQDNTLLPSAQFSIGDRIRMRLVPLNKAERPIRSMQRSDDLDDFSHQPYYVQEAIRQ